MPEAEIKAEHLFYAVKGEVLLQDFSFSFSPGRLYIFRGRSGCGKTALLSLLAGYIKPTSGQVTFASEIHRSSISFFSEYYLCFYELSVFENVSLYTKDRERVEEVLKLVGLRGKEKQSASSLSKGEIARLALARMILSDAKILFFDEPTANLDIGNQDRFLRILREVSKTRLVIITSHEKILYQKEDVLFEYDDERHSFFSSKFETGEEEKGRISFSYPTPERPHLTKRSLSVFLLSLGKRSWKQLTVLFVLFSFLFFTSFFSLSFLERSGEEIFYKDMVASHIGGCLVENEKKKEEEGIYRLSEVTYLEKEEVAAYSPSDSLPCRNQVFFLKREDGILIPSSFAETYRLKENENISLTISGSEKRAVIEGIYPSEEVALTGIFQKASEEQRHIVEEFNAPIFLSSKLIEKNPSENEAMYYATTDYFRKRGSLEVNPYLLSIGEASILANKKEFDKDVGYLFLASLFLLTAALYFLSFTLANSFQREAILFWLSSGCLHLPRTVLAVFSSIFLFFAEIVSICVYAPLLGTWNHFLSDFFFLKDTLPFLKLSSGTIAIFFLLFLFALLISSLWNLFFLQKKRIRYKKRKD